MPATPESILRAWFDGLWNRVSQGGLAVARCRVKGTQRGALPDLPATGLPVTFERVAICQVDGDRVTAAWNCFDFPGVVAHRGRLLVTRVRVGPIRASGRLVVPSALCAVLALTASVAGQELPTRQSEHLVGPVRTVAGETWDASRDGDRPGTEQRHKPIDTVTFDAAGRVTTRDIIDDYGFAVGREVYRYDGARLVESVLRDEKAAVLERRTYAYGARAGVEASSMAVSGAGEGGYEARFSRTASGRLERITYLVKGVEMGHTTLTYEEGPDPVVVAFFLATGARAVAPVGPCLGAHRMTYRYTGGKVAEHTLFEPDGARKRRSAFTYDAAGNVSSERRIEPSGETRLTHVFEYDRRGNWITRTTTVARTDRVRGGASPPLISITRRTLTYE